MQKANKNQQVNGFGVSKIYIADIMLDTSLKILEWLYNTCSGSVTLPWAAKRGELIVIASHPPETMREA